MDKKEVHISFSVKLCKLNTEDQIYGCRQYNPNICVNNGIEGVCTFYSKDYICVCNPVCGRNSI